MLSQAMLAQVMLAHAMAILALPWLARVMRAQAMLAQAMRLPLEVKLARHLTRHCKKETCLAWCRRSFLFRCAEKHNAVIHAWSTTGKIAMKAQGLQTAGVSNEGATFKSTSVVSIRSSEVVCLSNFSFLQHICAARRTHCDTFAQAFALAT